MPAQAAKKPFLWGSRPIWKQIATIPITPGLQAPSTKIPKNGWLAKMRYRLVGTATVTIAGTAGTPKLQNIVSNIQLSVSGNYQYRNVDLETLILKTNLQTFGSLDPVFSGPGYQAYNPASATAQAFSIALSDSIALNTELNADEFLLAAQARNYDLILDVNFGASASIAANTETAAIAGVLVVEGMYFLDPDYNEFDAPDPSTVQQLIDDKSFTNVVVGDNVIPVNPINGPEYLQLCFKPVFNNVIDTPGPASALTRVRLRVNNQQDIFDIQAVDLAAEQFEKYGRVLPFGYYVLDFLNDISLVNAMSAVRTRVLSTATLGSLELILTVASGTVTANSMIKLVKRLRNPAVA